MILKTSEEWYNEIYPDKELIIYDHDGWDRSNWDFSWYEEKITKDEFSRRVCSSTISANKSALSKL
jgi:hypothetical protein